jgi:AcrR family transcriptional regulator
MPTTRTSSQRLCADDWIQAGFAVLADHGPNALRVDRICERLNVTKGSFYWHFSDLQAYRAALVKAWGALRDTDRRVFENMSDIDPRERLAVVMSALASPRHWTLERVMRAWALTDEGVAASVGDSDRRVLRAVRHAFLDYGFAREEAEMRSAAVFTAGIGLLYVAGPSPDAPAEMRRRFLDFMLRP